MTCRAEWTSLPKLNFALCSVIERFVKFAEQTNSQRESYKTVKAPYTEQEWFIVQRFRQKFLEKRQLAQRVVMEERNLPATLAPSAPTLLAETQLPSAPVPPSSIQPELNVTQFTRPVIATSNASSNTAQGGNTDVITMRRRIPQVTPVVDSGMMAAATAVKRSPNSVHSKYSNLIYYVLVFLVLIVFSILGIIFFTNVFVTPKKISPTKISKREIEFQGEDIFQFLAKLIFQ
jgi:hypothetical protein